MESYTDIFNLYTTKDNKAFWMTNRRVEFPSDKTLYIYNVLTVTDDTPWTILSYKLYDTIKYWWVLCSLNNSNAFYAPEGQDITYIKKEYLEEILNMIDSI